MDDQEDTENFWEVVGSENFDTDREEFVARIGQCPSNEFAYDEKNATIAFTSACENLVVHYPELYTEIFCKVCGICVEIKSIINGLPDEAEPDDEDDMDEFLSVVGTNPNPDYGDDMVEVCADAPDEPAPEYGKSIKY